ncbi:MAG: PadR family transcriptional regulator [Actinomycetaceae bacterium]|nr:PadR family transcriptional regulator [Actinomycetaceae bacterium]
MISADAIRGYIDLIVLTLLRQRPSYAYELAKTITTVADGQYTIKQTTLYSALKRLETTGLVASYSDTSDSGKPRTYYRLTTSGSNHLTAKLAEWEDTKNLIDRFAGNMEPFNDSPRTCEYHSTQPDQGAS